MNKYFIILIILLTSFVSLGELINVKAGDFIGGEDYNVLKKDVVIKKGELIIETQMATITLVNDEWRQLVSSEMSIISDTYEASSNSTEFDLQTEKGILTGEVIANIFLNKSELNIITDILELDNKEKNYSGSSENITEIYKDDYVIKAKKFEYNESEKILYLTGNVSIINEKKKIELISDNATFNTETDEMKAEKVDLTLEIEDEE
jgi:lipopolysaccharide assembly outer membrane protein LptD (OstA)